MATRTASEISVAGDSTSNGREPILTYRQQFVLDQLQRGKTLAYIGNRLDIAPTVAGDIAKRATAILEGTIPETSQAQSQTAPPRPAKTPKAKPKPSKPSHPVEVPRISKPLITELEHYVIQQVLRGRTQVSIGAELGIPQLKISKLKIRAYKRIERAFPELRKPPTPSQPYSNPILTEREDYVLRELARGRSHGAIADDLRLSRRTIYKVDTDANYKIEGAFPIARRLRRPRLNRRVEPVRHNPSTADAINEKTMRAMLYFGP